MGIVFKANFDATRLKEQLRLKDRGRALERGMNDMAREIIKRTQSGKDVEGGAFKKYSPGYAAYKYGPKRTGGRNRGGYTKTQRAEMKGRGVKFAGGKGKAWGWHVPDLTLTGKMLDAITSSIKVEAERLIGRLYFNSAAEGTKAAANQGKRPFFGLSKEQRNRLIELIRNLWR